MDLMLWEKPVFTLVCPPFGEVQARVCWKTCYDKIISFMRGNRVNIEGIIKEIVPEIDEKLLTLSGTFAFFGYYIEAIEKYCEENIDIFGIPEHIEFGEERKELALPVVSCGLHMIAEYSGLSFNEINSLDILDYRLLLADSMKMAILSRADGKGREILKECREYMHRESSIFE